MTNQLATDIKQSMIMQAQGYDPATADMCYIDGILTARRYRETIHCEQIRREQSMTNTPFSPRIIKPAWSLAALLSLLPRGKVTTFYLGTEIDGKESMYVLWDSLFLSPGFKSESAVETVFTGLIWLTFNLDKIVDIPQGVCAI